MQVEEARSLAQELKSREEDRREKRQRENEEKAHRRAEKHFQPALKEVLRRIKDSITYRENKVDMCIEVKTFFPSGELCDGALEKRLLAQKLIYALKQLGYSIEVCSRGALANSANEYSSEILITSWIVKW